MRFVPVRHRSLGCHGSAYISIPYGWCLADARSSPISKFFHSTQSPGFKNACRRCKCSEIVPNSKNAKNRLFLEQKVANNHDPVVGTPFENSLKITC